MGNESDEDVGNPSSCLHYVLGTAGIVLFHPKYLRKLDIGVGSPARLYGSVRVEGDELFLECFVAFGVLLEDQGVQKGSSEVYSSTERPFKKIQKIGRDY